MRLLKTKLSIAAGGAGVLLLAAAGPALANAAIQGPFWCGPLGLTACGNGGVDRSNTHVYACDDVADGQGYAIAYRLRNGGLGSVLDGNGSAAGCGGRGVGSASNPVTSIEGCDVTAGVCTEPISS